MRLNDMPKAWLKDFTRSVLPKPGTPSSNTCTPAKKAMRTLRITSLLPTMTFCTSASKRLNMTWKFSGSINFLSSANHPAIFQRHLLLFRRSIWYVRRQWNITDRDFRTDFAASSLSRDGAFTFSIRCQFLGSLNGHIALAFDSFFPLVAARGQP